MKSKCLFRNNGAVCGLPESDSIHHMVSKGHTFVPEASLPKNFKEGERVFVVNVGFGKVTFDDGYNVTVLIDGYACTNSFDQKNVISVGHLLFPQGKELTVCVSKIKDFCKEVGHNFSVVCLECGANSIKDVHPVNHFALARFLAGRNSEREKWDELTNFISGLWANDDERGFKSEIQAKIKELDGFRD